MSETKGCKQCQQKNTNSKQIALGILGFYMLGSSIYGTIELFKLIVNYFK
jgi:hypothetical protein